MDPGAAAAQVYNMQNRNLYMTSNEQIIGDKADTAMYKAADAEYMANDLFQKFTELLKSEAFIYGTIGIIMIALIFVYRTLM